jgi:DHA2 family methylenomycin A resistance protein-like MFS transporter
MLGFFVVPLDAQIATVALPDIGSSLGGGLTGPQWVVTGYTLTFSALLLFAGMLSDRIGAKRANGMSMAVFVVASAACGFALAGRSRRGTRGARHRRGPDHSHLARSLREAYQQSRDRARGRLLGPERFSRSSRPTVAVPICERPA